MEIKKILKTVENNIFPKESDEDKMRGSVVYRNLSDPIGLVIGQKAMHEDGEALSVCVPNKADRNMNVAVFGSPGSGMSYSLIKPNILTRIAQNESFIITDPSGELYRDTAALAEKNDFNVKVLNLKDPDCSDGWNPFDILKAASDTEATMLVDSMVHTILSNTTDKKSGNDGFFDRAEEYLLKALILYVARSPHFKGQDWERHMGTVYDLLIKLVSQGGILEEFVSREKYGNINMPDTDPAAIAWKAFISSGVDLRMNFGARLMSKLDVFQNDAFKEIFSHSEIDLSALGKEKCAYYVVYPTTNSKMDFVTSLFFGCAFEQLILDVENSGKKPKTPVFFIMDDIKSVGMISSFGDKIASTHKYGISVMMTLQDLGDLKQLYRRKYSSILASCDTWVCTGVNDIDTARMLADRYGVIPASGISAILPGNKTMMTPNKIMTIFGNSDTNGKKVLVFARGRDPYMIYAYDLYMHKLAEYIGIENYRREIKDHVPEWQKGEYFVIGRYDRSFVPEVSELAKAKSEKEKKTKSRGIEFNVDAKSSKSTNPKKTEDKKPDSDEDADTLASDNDTDTPVSVGLDLSGKVKTEE